MAILRTVGAVPVKRSPNEEELSDWPMGGRGSRSLSEVLTADKVARWVLMLPTFLFLLGLTLYPVMSALVMSFRRWEAILPEKPFIGFENYVKLLTDDARFGSSLRITITILAAALALELLIGFGLALLLAKPFPGQGIIRSLILVPMMVSSVVVGFTARMAFNTSFGFVNQIISLLIGRPAQVHWLADPNLAVAAIILTDVWQWTPFVFLLVYSALISLPSEPFEAAVVDGASSWQVFRFVTFPQMRYILVVTVLLRGLEVMKLFDVIMLATRAGPGNATETVSVYIYFLGFKFWSLGYAAAASFLLLIAISIVAAVLVRRVAAVREI